MPSEQPRGGGGGRKAKFAAAPSSSAGRASGSSSRPSSAAMPSSTLDQQRQLDRAAASRSRALAELVGEPPLSRSLPAPGAATTAAAAAAAAAAAGVTSLTKAHRGLYDALDEDSWLETKFNRSGAAEPLEGELTVVIEYCYNSGESYAQLSSKHNEARYHEEAELVRRFFLNYHSGAVVFVVATDFRTAKERRTMRLGAFEIDARVRVDGKLRTHNLWSKLHTGKWPRWPDWQEGVRQMLPIFQLRLRPCRVFSDGSAAYLPHPVRVRVLNHDLSRTVLDADAAAGGALLRVLRGTYTVEVPRDEGLPDECYPEVATLNLTRVPVPRSVEPAELRVLMRARPALRVALLGDFPAGGRSQLDLPFCGATLDDVVITVTDRSGGPSDGQRLMTARGSAVGARPAATAARRRRARRR